ncbi:hypothetical protein DYB30_013219 [Aphanomyces astaci]|uniref:Uncharacterized protein n=1 Tax=Aphanomyces astaci TaxID=112090 RepID=A0A397E7N3_APHAT|nr:hypothetical protein DYB30_013219 [Aphanomyces astaci]
MPPRKGKYTASQANTSSDTIDRIHEKITSKRILWTKDVVGDGKSSIDVVIAWMSVETNYLSWKGGGKHGGATKASLALEVFARLSTQGIHHRTTKDVVQKIGDIERAYRSACDWLANTGQGVEDEDSIQKEVKRMYPYYYTLNDVMRDRASTNPLVTSETLYNASSGGDDDTQDDKKAPGSARKRSAASAKLDEWGDIISRAYELKKEQLEFTHHVEHYKLEMDRQREARLVEETRLNVRLLTIQADEAHWKYELAREMVEIEGCIRKIQTRKDLKERGWSDIDIDLACPM